VCSGKEHLHENHLHRSPELPKRKKEMKKTIAILLVMTIALAGVFAAETTLEVTTKIDSKAFARIVDKDSAILVNLSTYEDFVAIAAIADATSTEIGKSQVTLANLNFFSNAATAFTTTLTAKNMIDTSVDSEISYEVTVGASQSLLSDSTGSTTKTITLKAAGSTSSLAGTKAIAVDVVDADWDNAAAGNYTGILTFNFETI
jgi:hypothetical protein